MMRQLDYLNFLLRSTNQHGVHSPFVFQLVTRGLYDKTDKPVHGAIKHLPALQGLPGKYFRGLNNSMHHLFGAHTPEVTLPDLNPTKMETTPGLVFTDLANDRPYTPGQLLDLMHDDTLLLVLKNRTHPLWEELKTREDLHLTIDCYRFGFAFKRPQQAKENFTIRL